jgi:hypothetical protein
MRVIKWVRIPGCLVITFCLTFVEVHVSINVREWDKLFRTERTLVYRTSICQCCCFAHWLSVDRALNYSKSTKESFTNPVLSVADCSNLILYTNSHVTKLLCNIHLTFETEMWSFKFQEKFVLTLENLNPGVNFLYNMKDICFPSEIGRHASFGPFNFWCWYSMWYIILLMGHPLCKLGPGFVCRWIYVDVCLYVGQELKIALMISWQTCFAIDVTNLTKIYNSTYLECVLDREVTFLPSVW